MSLPQALPGFRDFYPEEMLLRSHLFRVWRQAAHSFGFQEYDAPVLEPLELFTKKSGPEIEGQLFSFTDKGGREVALRPEMTPSVCRLVGARAHTLKRPIKWFSIGEQYRYERMQKGRGRSFFQFNADIFGEPGPEAEVELIALLIHCLSSFGLGPEDFCIRLSDRNLWFYFLEALGLDEARARSALAAVDRHEKLGDEAFAVYTEAHGPLAPETRERILGFLAIRTFADLERAVSSLGHDKAAARLADWKQLLAGLEAMGLGDFVRVDLGVVRGLAYYTGFVFEAFDSKGELRAIAGGGRYDNLVAKLGGPELSALGFAIGDMTLALLLQARGLTPPLVQAPDVYAVIGGSAERPAALRAVLQMRRHGYRVEYALRDTGFGKQFKQAGQSGARVAAIFGAEEVARGELKLKDLRSGEESSAPLAEVLTALARLFGR